MSEPLDCAIHNDIAHVFVKHCEENGGMIVGADRLQSALVKSLLRLLQRREKEEREPVQQRHHLPTVNKVRVTCAACKKPLWGRERWPGDPKGGYNCYPHKCRDGKRKSTVGVITQ